MFQRCFLTAAVWVTAVSMLAGCGGKPLPKDMPKLYPCTVKIVDQNDNPVPQVIVVIVSDDPTFKWGASGGTNESGIAVMQTLGEYRGVVPGSYKILARLLEPNPTGQFDEEGIEIVLIDNLLKLEYSDPKKTPLAIEVGTKATNITLQVEMN